MAKSTKKTASAVAKLASKAGAKLAKDGKAAPPAKPAKSAAPATGKGKATPFVRKYQDSQKLIWLGDNGKVNPRQAGKPPHERYAALMASKTVGEALKKGAWSGTISRAVKEGRLQVK